MKRLLIGLGALALVVAGVGVVYGQRLGLLAALVFAHAPDEAFDAAKAPPAPDYADAASWAALPGKRDASDVAPPGEAIMDPAQAPADVFFIHPTSFFSNGKWNQKLDDADTNARTDSGAIRNQASAFNGCCAVYAPRYRQMTFGGFLKYDANSQGAMALAYSDVKRAFEYYLAHDNHGRPFILAGHSQGARHLRTLLAEMIDGKPLAKQLVAAYDVGTWMDEDWFKARKTLKPCERADDTGCVLTWSSVLEGADAQKQREAFAKRSGYAPEMADKRYVCTNPLDWSQSDKLAPASLDMGGWVYGRGDEPRAIVPELVSARCDNGALFVSKPDDGAFNIAVLPGGNYHNYDYQLAWLNIRRNAEARVKAFLAKPPSP